MNRDDEPSDDETLPFPDCPQCGEPVLFSVVLGPGTSSVGPCGCPVSPGLLERERD